MKRSVVVIFCFILSVFAITSFATEVTLFGPHQYVRTSGAPDVFTDAFLAIPGEGMLIVKNGSIDGNNRITDAISSASVYVNGQQIFGPNNFNQNVYLLQAPVNLAENNTITVELASSPGSYLTIEVKQDQQQNQPNVTLSADPLNIMVGESSTLTWNSVNADTCEIDQGIGSVNLNGSVSVSPAQTTTYTITATNADGTATDSITVTVTYPAPTVSISAVPETILVGESATLTWSSTDADSAVIDQGIGTVATNGSVMVSPAETTMYTITVTGPGGTATADVTVNVSPIGISITSPLDGETLSRPDTLVQGTIINPLGNEVGVNINGVVAMVYGNQFVANHVPLEEGENTISAIATDADGNTATASITINALTTENYIGVTADTESSVPPLETTLEVDGSFSFAQPTISYTGPGTVEFLDSTNPNAYNIKMTKPGIYFFTGEVTDDQSNTYTDTIAVVVLDQAQLDALLREKWGGMKAALSNGDIQTAVSYIAESSSGMYEFNFNLMNAYLPDILAGLQNIELVQIRDGMAEYNMLGEQDGQTYSFYLLFVKDLDGIWRIKFF